MAVAGVIVGEILALLTKLAQPGVSTAELDAAAEDHIRGRGALPAFKGYNGYPASICASLNNEVVHGIPSPERKLHAGDLLSLDVGARINGWNGDAAVTVPVGAVDSEGRRLLAVTQASLEAAIALVKPGAQLGTICHAIETCATAAGFSVVREWVGHGIGRQMHEEPQIPNYGEPGTGPRLAVGMVLAIEPMVNTGGFRTRVLGDNWTVVTADGSRSAHFEHIVAVTAQGARILTVAG
ncbi:MAG TPA: type I methionyl aminopeptidase [bacterium]|nr:type I methionyl aminopeptidase [bacterium]